jgi:5-formyltetrahydrofolate cyclo-ligase
MNIHTKQAIRQLTKVNVLALSSYIRIEKEITIFATLEKLIEFQQAKHILCYWALSDEVNTALLIRSWEKEKQFYLPVVKNNELVIKPYSSNKELQQGAFAIQEPTTDSEVSLSVIDLIIVPGVAFDELGNRLGRGKGYYDRLLQQQSITKIALAYSEQVYESIPTELHDVKMDIVLSA